MTHDVAENSLQKERTSVLLTRILADLSGKKVLLSTDVTTASPFMRRSLYFPIFVKRCFSRLTWSTKFSQPS